MLHYLVLVGAFVQLVGVLLYIKEIFHGTTKPNQVTWLMWSVAPLIGSIAAFSNGVTWAVIPVFMAGFSPFLVFLASFLSKQSYWKLNSFDYLCGLFSILALILWGVTGEPLLAILFAIISDAFAAIPTILKSWNHPESESSSTYIASLFGVLTTFLALNTFSLSELAFPIYLILLNLSILWAIYRGHLKAQ